MKCDKFDCRNEATHVLVLASELLGRVDAHARCEGCGKADIRTRLAQRVVSDMATELYAMPGRQQS